MKREQTCCHCGEAYYYKGVLAKEPRFCSLRCRGLAQSAANTVDLCCAHCGKNYRKPASQNGRSRFCSQTCKVSHSRNEVACKMCGKLFSFRKGISRSYCSRACMNKVPHDWLRVPDVERVCAHCGKTYTSIPSLRKSYCSKECRIQGTGARYRGKLITAKMKPCDGCGKMIKVNPSKESLGSKHYCSQRCFRFYGGISSLEHKVAAWLTDHGLSFEQQVPLGNRYIDFFVDGVYIEVNGCYWHGCPSCFPNPTARQLQRRDRDSRLAARCARRGQKFISIWEHDIINGHYDALFSLLDPSGD